MKNRSLSVKLGTLLTRLTRRRRTAFRDVANCSSCADVGLPTGCRSEVIGSIARAYNSIGPRRRGRIREAYVLMSGSVRPSAARHGLLRFGVAVVAVASAFALASLPGAHAHSAATPLLLIAVV